MLRGVSRRVVEINECKSEMFERAIFFVRPDAPDFTKTQLQNEAEAIIQGLSAQPSFMPKRRRRISRRGLWALLALSVAGGIISLVCNLI